MKLRLSHSLMYAWERGEPDRVVQMYFRMKSPTTPQMQAGTDMHKEISQYIVKNKELPPWLAPFKLNNPEPDKQVIVSYNELFDLKGLFDCYDEGDIHEFKSGRTDSLEYLRQDQIPFYFLLAELSELPAKRAFLFHYNQYDKRSDWAMLWNSPDVVERARNRIDTIGPEIYEFFKSEGLV